MKLLVQPGDGVLPLTKAIAAAKRTLEIAIFRFDRGEIETALANAVARGVSVHALIAHTNRAGEANLRALETRLLGVGAKVSRTATDLLRYHDKLMIVDRRELYLLAFNLTYADIERSRSFAVTTKGRDVVREAVRLFEADSTRHPFETQSRQLVVSPINARKLLAGFIQGARKELVIYDPKISDPDMVRLLRERGRDGVRIRILGELVGSVPNATAYRLANLRLHTRTMVRDGKTVFMGSQSLRKAELETRREVGLIFRDPKIAARLVDTFESDWAAAEQLGAQNQSQHEPSPPAKIAKKIAKEITRQMPPVAPLLNGAVKEITAGSSAAELNEESVEERVKDAVKAAVKDVVQSVVEETAERAGGAEK